MAVRAALTRLRTRESFFTIYVDLYIRYARPRTLITFIDNDLRFWTLKKRHPEVQFIAVQNGRRGGAGDVSLDSLDPTVHGVDSFYSFGKAYGDHISKRTNTMRVVDHGSFKNNLVLPDTTKKKGAGWISQYRPPSRWNYGGVSHEAFFEADRQAFGLFARWCVERNLEIEILGRSRPEEVEEELGFYRRVAPRAALTIRPNTSDLASYSAVDAKEVVSTVSSSLGYEALARGTKAFFFDYRSSFLGLSEYKFGYPLVFSKTGIFWTSSQSAADVFHQLDTLRGMSKNSFKQAAQSVSKPLVAWEPGNRDLKRELSGLILSQLDD